MRMKETLTLNRQQIDGLESVLRVSPGLTKLVYLRHYAWIENMRKQGYSYKDIFKVWQNRVRDPRWTRDIEEAFMGDNYLYTDSREVSVEVEW